MSVQMSRRQIRNTVMFAATLGVGVLLSTHDAWSLAYLRYATYFTVAGASAVWLFRLIAWGRAKLVTADPSPPTASLTGSLGGAPLVRAFRQATRDHLPEIALAVAAVTVLFLTNDWQFKVLSDETNLVATARSFSSEGRFDFPGHSAFRLGTSRPADYAFDKRPPLFAFLLSVVDSLTGYRVANVWILNGLLLGATVLVVAVFLRRRLGRPWNVLSVGWALANPIVMQTASAAGVEPTLCFFWALVGILTVEVIEGASTTTSVEERFDLLLATVFMLGLARLEAGPLAVLLLIGAILASPDRKALFERLREDWLLWMGPAVAMPVIIQKARIKDYFQGTTTKPFALDHVRENVLNWRKVFIDGGRFYPFNALVTAVEVIALVVLVVLVVRRRTALSAGGRRAFLLFAAVTSVFFALYSAYYWGQPTNPTSARFYALPFFFAGLTVIPVALRVRPIADRAWAASVIVGLVFAYAFPAAHNRAFPGAIAWRKQHLVVTDFVLPQLPKKQILLVTQVAGQFTIYDVGSIGFEDLRSGPTAIYRDLEKKVYDEVLVVQEMGIPDHEPTEKTAVPANIELVPLLERQITSTSSIRISRLVPPARADRAHKGAPARPSTPDPVPPATGEPAAGSQNGMSSSGEPPPLPPP